MSNVIIDHPSKHVVRLMINRPEAKNAIDFDTRNAFIDALKTALSDEENRAILLCGNQGVFCAGGDLMSMRGLSKEDARKRMQSGHELVKLVWDSPVPVVAAVEKYAIGAGAGLALLSDYIVTGEGAFFSFPFLDLGLVPDWGTTQMLVRRVGWGRARQLILDRSSLRGQELYEVGIADSVVADSEVMTYATKKASEFTHFSSTAFRRFKRRLQAYPESFERALSAEAEDQVECLTSREFEERISVLLEARDADSVSGSRNSN